MLPKMISIDAGWWIVSSQQKLWLPEGKLPFGTAEQLGFSHQEARFIGEYRGNPVWLICSHCQNQSEMYSVRHLLEGDLALFHLAGRGIQLAEFLQSYRWCHHCGYPLQCSKHEFYCFCQRCKQDYYPQLSPCIIVAIRKGKSILLANHVRSKDDVYTTLAGFVEVGETLEQAVSREVAEETAITIKNLRYVTSQPWPFPHSLMMAFMADYHTGEIAFDKKELNDARWFCYDNLPQLPPSNTVARHLIEKTVALCCA